MYEADALQAALYAALTAGTSVPWYDHVPPGTAYPYGVLGLVTETPEDLHDGDGSEVTATLHIWSDALGTRQVNETLREIDAALHHGTLSVSGARCWSVEREFTELLRDEDVATGRPLQHAVARYRISIQEVP